MFKRNLVFKTLAFFGITLLALTGCPNVVDSGDEPTTPSQGDVEIDVSVTKGATSLGIKLSVGRFKLDQKAEYFKPGTGFSIPDTVTIKVASDKKSLIIKGCASTVESQTTIKMTISKDAFETPSSDTDVAKKDNTNGGAQENISSKSSADNAAKQGFKAIVVILEGDGLFDSGITGADFTHAPDGESKIKTTDESPVVVSPDKKTATIYGTAVDTGVAKIGIKASALVGYPHVTAENVTVTSAKGYVSKASSEPVQYDNYITVTLGEGKTFVAEPALKAFTLNTGSIAIGETGKVTLNSGKTKAVIKAATPSSDETTFTLNIDEYVFTSTSLPIVDADITAVSTTQQVTPLTITAPTSGTPSTTLIATIANGGKFKTGLTETTGFSLTCSDGTLTLSKVEYNTDETVATITLSQPDGDNVLSEVKLTPATVLDDSWPVVVADITLSWGSASAAD